MSIQLTQIPRTIDTLTNFLENKKDEYRSAYENIRSGQGWKIQNGEFYFEAVNSLYNHLYTKIYEPLLTDSALTDSDITGFIDDFLYWAAQEKKKISDLDELAHFGILTTINSHVHSLLYSAFNKFKQLRDIYREEQKLAKNYISTAKPPTARKQTYKIGIVTVTEEEHNAALEILSGVKIIPPKENNAFTYRTGHLKGGKKGIKVILVQCLHQGAAAAAVATSQMITSHSPEIMAMIGHAAGNKSKMKKCSVGDIMLAKESIDFEQVTITEQSAGDNPPEIIEKPKKRPVPANTTLVTSALQFKSTGILQQIKDGYPDKALFEAELKLFPGIIVSGSAMVRSETWFNKVMADNPGAIGWDMEIFGFYYAIENTTFGNKPKGIAMKSISDYGSKKTKYPEGLEDHTVRVPYACYTSADFFRQFAIENLGD
ncbi:hypothetical protein [Pedobacter sp. D749]|uniref:phosphorylase family protein n=1 Tax=Pedobacter sp. D749 TaxID=2856523 RepID=UPI001C55F0FA|nr:hypothetical protein [Pedobacter sp. D749]QXU39693.1 hypothetical protein KYH19_11690 [Pedobacter sp. D749]